MIPPTIHPSVRSGAERKLFAVIRDAAGTDDWVCLHSLGLARHSSKRRGEIDFLLLTRKGVFVLEVKGGRVSREEGIWRFTDRYGDAHRRNEGPFDQAASAMFALEADIRAHFHDDKRRCRLLFGFGVMVPDIVFNVDGVEGDPRQVYDLEDRRRPFAMFVDRLAEYWRECDPCDRYAPTVADIEGITHFLRGDFDLVPPLRAVADDTSERLLALEQEQYSVLDAMTGLNRPRVLVQGGAGTGKTLLAVEAARRAARESDRDVLFLCYNRLLAAYLDAKFAAEPPQGGKVAVKSILSLLNSLIDSSTLADEFITRRKEADATTVFRQLIPEYAALAVLETQPHQYGTLVIDEAQDMMTDDLLDVIDAHLAGGLEAGRWWIFCDTNNQAAVFGAFDEESLLRLTQFGQVMVLPTNRRNTRQIGDETTMLSRPRVHAVSAVDGMPVKYTWYAKPEDESSALSRVLKRLLSEQIAPHRITVLSPKRMDQSCAASVRDPHICALTTQNVWDVMRGARSMISCCSVSAFKGLENDFIVLTDIDDLQAEWWRSVIYVGMSRARVGLHLLLKESMRPVYKQCLRGWLRQKGVDLEPMQ